jgi:hypothetical protein
MKVTTLRNTRPSAYASGSYGWTWNKRCRADAWRQWPRARREPCRRRRERRLHGSPCAEPCPLSRRASIAGRSREFSPKTVISLPSGVRTCVGRSTPASSACLKGVNSSRSGSLPAVSQGKSLRSCVRRNERRTAWTLGSLSARSTSFPSCLALSGLSRAPLPPLMRIIRVVPCSFQRSETTTLPLARPAST